MMDLDLLNQKLDEAESKAWRSLSKYKFLMFGYWCAVWVHLNHLLPVLRPNPWKKLVGIAKKEVGSEKLVKNFPGVFRDQ